MFLVVIITVFLLCLIFYSLDEKFTDFFHSSIMNKPYQTFKDMSVRYLSSGYKNYFTSFY